jgi:hypothetical protein
MCDCMNVSSATVGNELAVRSYVQCATVSLPFRVKKIAYLCTLMLPQGNQHVPSIDIRKRTAVRTSVGCRFRPGDCRRCLLHQVRVSHSTPSPDTCCHVHGSHRPAGGTRPVATVVRSRPVHRLHRPNVVLRAAA